jgi:SAM-dependent methyltransferase
MSSISPIDEGRHVDWGKTSADYSVYRPGPPESFYRRLLALDVGLRGQRILDLGTGTGALARQFAKQGAVVAGIDISGEQIQAAKALATVEGSSIDFQVAPAEEVPFPDGSFDVITANQCWLYFDKEKAIPEARRVLIKGGLLVTSHFSWLPRLDRIAAASERLVLKYNPQWSAADYTGEVSPLPKWAEGILNVKAFFYYDEAIHFTRDAWRGRIRACRGIGAALSGDEVQRFDEEHERLLKNIAGERFAILHRIGCHVLEFKVTDRNELPPLRAG